MRDDRRGRNVWRQVVTALIDLSGGKGELLRHAERPWATATFAGTRHTVALCFSGPEAVAAGEALVSAVPEHEFTLPSQLVADATVASVEQEMLPRPRLTVEVELLLLNDR